MQRLDRDVEDIAALEGDLARARELRVAHRDRGLLEREALLGEIEPPAQVDALEQDRGPIPGRDLQASLRERDRLDHDGQGLVSRRARVVGRPDEGSEGVAPIEAEGRVLAQDEVRSPRSRPARRGSGRRGAPSSRGRPTPTRSARSPRRATRAPRCGSAARAAASPRALRPRDRPPCANRARARAVRAAGSGNPRSSCRGSAARKRAAPARAARPAAARIPPPACERSSCIGHQKKNPMLKCICHGGSPSWRLIGKPAKRLIGPIGVE